MKTEVYSWRMSRGLKTDLERAARNRRVGMSTVLELAAREWLARNGQDLAADDEQRRLHALAERCIGTFASGNRRGSQTVRQVVRKRLARKYDR
jgi:hypothetical protein